MNYESINKLINHLVKTNYSINKSNHLSLSPPFQTNGLSGRAGESAQKSATLLSRARDLKTQVDEALWKQLEEARRMTNEAMAGNDEVEARLALITGDINGLPNGRDED